MGRHSFPEVCRRPSRSAAASEGGSASARTPKPRRVAAAASASRSHGRDQEAFPFAVDLLEGAGAHAEVRGRSGLMPAVILARSQPVLADAMEEGFHPRLGTGVPRMPIRFDDGVRAPLHEPGEERDGEAVGSTGVVRAEDAVEPRCPADLPGGSQNALAVPPEDLVEDGHALVHGQAIQRYGDGALLPEEGRDVGIQHVVVQGVAPAQQHHGHEVPFPAEGQGPAAQVLQIRFEGELGGPGGLPGGAPFRGQIPAQSRGQVSADGAEGRGVIGPGTEIHDGGQHLRSAFAQAQTQHVRSALGNGADHGVGFPAHPRQLPHHGQEEVVRLGVRHPGHEAVVLLHGRAERGPGFLDAALQGVASRWGGHLEVEAQVMEEGGEEGEGALELELAADPDEGPAPPLREARGQLGHPLPVCPEGIGSPVRQLGPPGALVP